jgi:hypothetical protein
LARQFRLGGNQLAAEGFGESRLGELIGAGRRISHLLFDGVCESE